jgi:cytochrome P450
MQSLSQSPTDPAFVQDPYPFYERARALGPLFHWQEFGLVCAPGQAAVGAILRDRRFGRATPEAQRRPVPEHLTPFYDLEAHSMLDLEPPAHTRLRGLVLRAFTSRRIAALAPEIAQLCQTLLDRTSGEFDLVDAYARPLPVIVIARLLGVPEEMADDLLGWSNAMVAMYQARRTAGIEHEAAAAARDFAAFLRGYIAERRSRPADDLLTHLIGAEADGDRLSTDEMISTCVLLLNAGHEATVHTLGNGVKALIEARTPRAALDAGAIEGTVEEVLRFDPPLHLFTRWVYEEAEMAGHVFRPGDQVGLLLAAANRDPAQWERPARFDPGRIPKPNVSFGAGIHFCVGAPLARLELQVALPALFARYPQLRIAAKPRYANLYHFHGLERLLVRDGA